MTQTREESAWDRVLRPWWAKMGVGAIMIVLAVLAWRDCAKLESGERKSTSLGRGTGFLYDIGGKPLAAGVPALVGVGFIVWGSRQLARGKETVTRLAPTPAPNPTGDSDAAKEMSYLQALYTTFWKPIFVIFGVVHALAAAGILKLIWPDAVGYAYAVAILLSVPVAYFNLEWMARRLRLDDGPIVDWHARATYLWLVGYTLAVALAAALAVNATNERTAAREREVQNEREKARMREMTNNPDVKAAEEYLRKRQEQQKR